MTATIGRNQSEQLDSTRFNPFIIFSDIHHLGYRGVHKLLRIHSETFRTNRIRATEATNNVTRSPISMRVAFAARSFSHQVAG